MTVRLIQITDCHLFADPHAELKGVCVRERFEAILTALRAERQSTDRLIVSGDLTHDERVETYRALHDMLGDWLPILRVIPGNHDDREVMRSVFGDSVCSDGVESAVGRTVFSEELGGWRLLGLDSQRTGSSAGQLDRPQLDWLAERLTAAADAPTAIFLHHPPVAVGSRWVDDIGLEDAAELLSLIRQSPQVKLVCAGHVHQETTIAIGPLVVLTTPAAAVQFLPNTEMLVVDSALPGYRVLELEPSGTFRTRIVRVAC